MIGEEPLDAHQGSRQDLHEAFADRLPKKREPKPEIEQSEQGYRQPKASQSRHKAKPLLQTAAPSSLHSVLSRPCV